MTSVADAVGWTAQLDGHSFYLLSLPQNDTHWVYDAANGLWTEWAHWNPDLEVWTPFRGRCHTFAYDTHLVGDIDTGMVSALSFDYFSDRRA